MHRIWNLLIARDPFRHLMNWAADNKAGVITLLVLFVGAHILIAIPLIAMLDGRETPDYVLPEFICAALGLVLLDTLIVWRTYFLARKKSG
jgi:hypothetical protein